MSKHHRINFVFLAIISVFLVTGFMAKNTFAAQFTSPLIAPNSPNCHGSVGDFVWNDLNGNGIQDAGEPGLSGVTVSLYNTTPSLIGTTTTDSNGNYLFSGLCESGVVYYLIFDKPATYNFTPQNQGDITIDSDPDPITGQTNPFTLNPGEYNDTLDAGLAQMDFGDLPSGYSNTLLANDGARHVMGGLILGEGISADSDGKVSPTASGDTFDDGIALDPASSWQPGNTVNLTVTVTGGDGYLAGWFDWNNDGALGAGELTISQAVSAGSHSISLIVPNDYVTGRDLFARFRLYPSDPGTPSPTGMVVNGEDEDYLWTFKTTAIQLSSFSAKAAASSSALPLSLAMIGFTTLVAAVWFIRKQQD